MKTRSRRSLAVAGTLTSILALAPFTACGGGGDGARAVDDSTPSASAPSDPPTSPSADGTSADPGRSSSDDSSGAADTTGLTEVMRRTMDEGRSAHVTMKMGSAGSGEGDVAFDGKNTEMQMKITTSGQTVEMRFVDSVMYIAAPGQDGKWMKMDAGQMGPRFDVDLTESLKQIEEAGGAAKDLGNGEWELTSAGVTTTVHVGGDGFLDKVEVKGGPTGTMTMTYSDWGKDVTIEAPAKSDIIAMPTS